MLFSFLWKSFPFVVNWCVKYFVGHLCTRFLSKKSNCVHIITLMHGSVSNNFFPLMTSFI
ncbi:hypothetical protein NC652_009645 [Populus alba x Populus x berolinensis]|nr:hypothetical protein NC652_009645 [Populus alba x Populus x berolinensis]